MRVAVPAFMRNTLLVVVAIAACGAPSSRPAPAMGAPTGLMERGMINCPSAVAGARTVATDVDGGIALAITAADPKAQQDIRDAALVQSRMGVPREDEHVVHTGEHGGPGTHGHCPVIHIDTMITVTDIDGGTRITILSTDPARTDAMRADVRARLP